jgi:flagellar assembly protein FliH
MKRRIISRAKRNAQAEIEECKKRGFEEGYNSGIESGKEKGYEEGFSDGYKAGSIKAREELERLTDIKLKEINNMLHTIEIEKQNIITKFEKEIEKLPIDIAEKIMRQKIELKDGALSRIIESVIKDFKNEEWVKIYISDKDDALKIRADKGLIEELKKISDDVKFEISKELKEASCIVETQDRIIDASVETQLKNLREILFK